MTMNDLRVNELFEMEPFEDAFRRLLRPWRSDLQDRGAPQIKVDVAETDMNYTLKAEVPGVRKEDIEVRIDGNQVNISAEVKKESEEKKDGRVIRSERRYGYASRSLWLDSPVDDAKAQAKYNNGVLELTLPKKAATSTKRLAIE
jgi:HSP20 family protein